MWEKIREYLTFTRKERLGVCALLIIITVLFILPYALRPAPGSEDREATGRFAPLLKQPGGDSLLSGTMTGRQSGAMPEFSGPEEAENRGNQRNFPTVPLTFFDPNRLDQAGWRRLGLTEKQSLTLVHYIGKGGRFRNPGDLRKIYGLTPADQQRLMPFVRIAADPERMRRDAQAMAPPRQPPVTRFQTLREEYHPTTGFAAVSRDPGQAKASGDYFYPRKTAAVIDINLADSQQWQQLPGIGEKLAARIIRFRQRLGGFYTIGQVGETFGLPDSTFAKIRPWLNRGNANIQVIDLNAATPEQLRQHPYIRWKLATALLRYREQHGGFGSLEELGQLALMDSGSLEKLKPYLTLGAAAQGGGRLPLTGTLPPALPRAGP